MSSKRKHALLTYVLVALMSTTALMSTAQAQLEGEGDATEEERAEAFELFNTGRAMMQEAGRLDEACETLTTSYEKHQRGDTLLNLAECHRRQGKTATAWREFDEAIRYAEAVEFTEAMSAAATLRDELAKDLSQLVVDVPKELAGAEKLEVVLDGKRLPKEQWGEQLYVDPGVHTVSATAEGYEPFDGSADVKGKAHRAVLTVALKKIPPPPPPPAPPPPPPPKPPPPPPPSAELPVWPLVVGGAGLVMMGVSVAFGIDTASVGSDLDDQCGPERTECPRDFDFNGARTNELRSFGFFVGMGVAGVAATTAGVLGLVFGLNATPERQVGVAPWVSPTGGGLGLSGRLY